ncbi:sigma-70 family RNA polymerase sigma factor [Fluviicola chungangensis]|uniref:Sigma-70 family RNA polymerase sigma factor n=1 Tax=Fluviicola chungangensis TaxID=2597671 RepID=A0A556N5Z8_9FLAO|nr:sigma-70 family RNA polymerase sigma factor [Fluviicola chungangensis]TSJ47555.1 sigma-70 family RNA polymerase sigma factor [Fluviicola chungangensis]
MSSNKNTEPALWVERFADYLYSIACIQLNDKELAKDLVSETFLSALQNLEKFRGESSEKTWLTRILNNKIIDHYRKSSTRLKNLRHYLESSDEQFYQAFFEPSYLSDYHWKEKTSPVKNEQFTDYLITNGEFQLALEYCLKQLSPKLKPVFIAKFIHEDDSETICKEFEISPSNYWIIIHRAKLLMRACLEHKWLNESR